MGYSDRVEWVTSNDNQSLGSFLEAISGVSG